MDLSHKHHPGKKAVPCRPQGPVLPDTESGGSVYRTGGAGLLRTSHLAQLPISSGAGLESRRTSTRGRGTQTVGVDGGAAVDGGKLGVSLHLGCLPRWRSRVSPCRPFPGAPLILTHTLSKIKMKFAQQKMNRFKVNNSVAFSAFRCCLTTLLYQVLTAFVTPKVNLVPRKQPLPIPPTPDSGNPQPAPAPWVCLFWTLPTNGTLVGHMAFGAWLLSMSIVVSRVTHTVASVPAPSLVRVSHTCPCAPCGRAGSCPGGGDSSQQQARARKARVQPAGLSAGEGNSPEDPGLRPQVSLGEPQMPSGG